MLDRDELWRGEVMGSGARVVGGDEVKEKAAGRGVLDDAEYCE